MFAVVSVVATTITMFDVLGSQSLGANVSSCPHQLIAIHLSSPTTHPTAAMDLTTARHACPLTTLDHATPAPSSDPIIAANPWRLFGRVDWSASASYN